MTPTLNGVFYGILAMAAWGTADYFAAIASRKSGSFNIFFLTQAISLFAFALIFLFVPFRISVSGSTLIISVSAALLMIIAYASFYKSLEVGKVAVGTSISACWALLTVFIAYFFFKEPLSTLKFVGIALAVFGILLTSLKKKDFVLLRTQSATSEKGVLLGLIALIGWGIAFALLDILVSSTDWFHAIFLIKLATVLLVIPYALFRKIKISLDRTLLINLLMVGVLETIAYLSLGFGFSIGSATLVAPIASTYPVAAAVLARLLLKEKLESNQYLGICFVIIAVVILAL